MSDCPSSEKIQAAIIPELNCNNTVAPESILRLPTTLPGVIGTNDLVELYEFTTADIETDWSAVYYNVTADIVAPSTDSVVCVDNTAVGYDNFTWVDWLQTAQQKAGKRPWIHQLECAEDGAAGAAIIGPVRPPNARAPIMALPMPSVTVNVNKSGGGGGGDKNIDYVFIDSNSIKVNVDRIGAYTKEIQHWVDSDLLQSSDGTIKVKTSGKNSMFSGWDISCTHVPHTYLMISTTESITIDEIVDEPTNRTMFDVNVDWTHVVIDPSLEEFIEADYDDIDQVTLKLKSLTDGVLIVQGGVISMHPLVPNTVLAVDADGNLIDLPYSDCESACEEPSSSSI